MHVTLVHVRVLPGHVADFIAATRDNHLASVREPGNVRFDVLQAPDDPTRFVLYEAYADASAASAHKETDHYRAWRETVAPMMAEPRRGRAVRGALPGRRVTMDADGALPGTAASGAALPSFEVARLPRLVVGPGRIAEVPALVAAFGRSALLVTGARSFPESPAWPVLVASLEEAGLGWDHVAVAGEPSPELVDAAVAARRADPPDVVVGIGGGSALDTAKAIAGLLRSGTVGARPPGGRRARPPVPRTQRHRSSPCRRRPGPAAR